MMCVWECSADPPGRCTSRYAVQASLTTRSAAENTAEICKDTAAAQLRPELTRPRALARGAVHRDVHLSSTRERTTKATAKHAYDREERKNA